MQQSRHFTPIRRHALRVGHLIIALVLCLSPRSALAQDQLLWGALKPGPHAVGFRSAVEFDHTRQYDPDYAEDPLHPPPPHPRPIFIGVWYPARASNAEPMTYRQYLEVTSADPRAASFSQRLTTHMREIVCLETLGKYPTALAADEKESFERLLACRCFGVMDAPPSDARFPVIVYHPGLGGTYEDNSVLFEYLASHGYVVVSSAYPMLTATQMNIDWDLSRSFRDFEFLCRYACALPFADTARLAAMGHSSGAQAALAWCAQPASSISAVVTLDSGLEYLSIDDPSLKLLKQPMEENRLNLRAASLRFARSDEDPHFDYLERYLKYAPAYEASVDPLTHNEFLTHGAIRPALMPGKWPDAAKARAVRLGYDRECEHILRFLDCTLKQQTEAREFLQRSLKGDGLDDHFKLRFRPPAPPPPTARQLALYVQRHGVEKAVDLLRSCREDVEHGGDGIGGAGQILIDAGQPEVALALFKGAIEVFPDSRPLHANLGNVLALTGDKEGAIAAYREVLAHIRTESIDEETRARWIKEVETILDRLGEKNASPPKK